MRYEGSEWTFESKDKLEIFLPRRHKKKRISTKWNRFWERGRTSFIQDTRHGRHIEEVKGWCYAILSHYAIRLKKDTP